MNKKKVVQFGLGPIGLKTIQYILGRPDLQLVGAVDKDPEKIGKDVSELGDLHIEKGITVTSDINQLLKNTDADIVVLTTTSSLGSAAEQIKEILNNKVNIVSTCEELSYPWITNTAVAAEIDNLAKKRGVSVLSTGVNPGFLMDTLPLVVSGVCRDVKKVVIERIQNAQFRRIPFQRKIGAGLTVAEFEKRVAEGSIRHVGLTESMHMIAARFGWKPEKTEDIIRPVIAREKVTAGEIEIEAGNVLGVEQIGKCYIKGEELITLIFRASIGEPQPRDSVCIKGTPDLELQIKDGVNGDVATCAMVVNAIPVVINARPGLRTMADIEPVTFFC